MNPRARRIVDTAIDLAEKGGFEAVRLRDVAAEADVALGTLYRYFHSKEDMLIAALSSQVEVLELRIQTRPMPGGTPHERVDAFFRAATKGLMRRPRLARAILRAATSGDHELAGKVAAFHTRMSAMILSAMHGRPAATGQDGPGNGSGNGAGVRAPARLPSEDELAVAKLLQHVWFSSLIGWAGGLMGQTEVIEQMSTATMLLMRGASMAKDDVRADGERKR